MPGLISNYYAEKKSEKAYFYAIQGIFRHSVFLGIIVIQLVRNPVGRQCLLQYPFDEKSILGDIEGATDRKTRVVVKDGEEKTPATAWAALDVGTIHEVSHPEHIYERFGE